MIRYRYVDEVTNERRLGKISPESFWRRLSGALSISSTWQNVREPIDTAKPLKDIAKCRYELSTSLSTGVDNLRFSCITPGNQYFCFVDAMLPLCFT
jgi:hypothetical protein